MRFYPAELPPFEHEPSPDRFAIRGFNDHIGEGVVSLVAFEPGDVVFAFTGFLVAAPTKFTLQASSSLHVHDPFFMGKVLHHCDPNCTVDMDRRLFIARQPIAPGDPITMDYDQTEDVLFRSFECACDAERCRGLIEGRIPPTKQKTAGA